MNTADRNASASPEGERQQQLLSALLRPETWPWPVDRVELIETHISLVLLAGDFACKLKKPLDLGFLDFSTLEKRHHFCKEEIRINRRLAPEHYLRVIAISGEPDAPRIDDELLPVIEYAVLMRRFPAGRLMNELADADNLPIECMDALAETIAQFHEDIPASSPDDAFGTFDSIAVPMRDNFDAFEKQLPGLVTDELEQLREWTEEELARQEDLIETRRKEGFVRECHGDLHLGNIAWFDDHVLVFDAIEFSAELRWIDTINELAFLVMDVDLRLPSRYRWRLLDRYLQATGDYRGLHLLRLYCAYRAMVRAKIHALRAAQFDTDSEAYHHAAEKAETSVKHALQYCKAGEPRLSITCGLSASGKSTLAARLVETEGAIRLRSDVERKRLFGLRPQDDAAADPGAGIYADDASARTYSHLLEISAGLLEAGYPVIVDAAFLRREHRETFRALAEQYGAPFRILLLQVEPDVLRQRLAERRASGNDASDATQAVLEAQIRSAELPGESESSWLEVHGPG